MLTYKIVDGVEFHVEKTPKYKDVNMSSLTSNTTIEDVGLLRLGELMAGQFDRKKKNISYWILTSHNNTNSRAVFTEGRILSTETTQNLGIKPALNLKSNILITGGDGTKQNPFQIKLAS